MHKLDRLIRFCLLVQIFCKLSYGWSSGSCSYSDAFLHTEFAVMGFFLLKYALHLGISHYAAWLLLAWQCRLLFFFTASLPKRSKDSYRTCRLCNSNLIGWLVYRDTIYCTVPVIPGCPFLFIKAKCTKKNTMSPIPCIGALTSLLGNVQCKMIITNGQKKLSSFFYFSMNCLYSSDIQ